MIKSFYRARIKVGTIITKRCSRCGLPKPLDAFRRDKKSKDGHGSICKLCLKDSDSAYYAAKREELIRKSVAYNKANPQRRKARDARYRAAHPERLKEQQNRFKLNNPERSIEIKRRWNEVHKDEKRKKESLRYRQNKAAIANRIAKWVKENPEKFKATQKRHRARKANAPICDLTHEQWVAIQEQYNHRCAYCGRKCKGRLTQDHIQPLSKGGSHTVSNVVPACQSCNSKKHVGPPLVPVQPLLLTFIK